MAQKEVCPRDEVADLPRTNNVFSNERHMVSLLISILRLDLVLTCGIISEFRDGVHLFIQTAIRHRVSPEFIWSRKPQDSSKRVLPWQVTMDQLICCASLSHIHYWYEVGMLKVPVVGLR